MIKFLCSFGLLGIVELVAAEIVFAQADGGKPPPLSHTPEVSLHGPARADASLPTYTSPLQNLFHAVNYTIKCDRSVNFGYVQAAEATYCTATTETPPAVSHFGTASLSVTVRQAEMNVSNATTGNNLKLFISKLSSLFQITANK